MRIGYLTYALDRAPTGIGRYALELLRALARHPAGPEIVLLSTEREDKHGLWREFETHHLPGCSRLPALMTLGNIVIGQAARRHRLDLIHDPNGIAPFFGGNLATRRIVTLHDAFAYVYPKEHNRLDTWRYRLMLPRVLRHIDRVLTDSQHSSEDLKRYLPIDPARLHVIHCGIGDHFRPMPASAERSAILEGYGIKPPYLLYVGGINARKNISRLFEAFALVRQTHPNVKLVIGGKRQWQTGEIDTTFQRLSLEAQVQFTGYLDDADLPAIYSAAEGFVFPSLYEGFGIPPLESMACGTPVITSNVSSLPEVVGDAALLIDPLDVQGLATAMRRILGDEPLRQDLRRRGIEQAARFTWQETANLTLAIYHKALMSPPRAGKDKP